MSDIVECHSGCEYAEKPVALTWQGQRHEVSEILARWRTPDTRCFRVKTNEGRVFEISYDELCDEWQINQI